MNNGSISICEYFSRWQIVLQEKILLEAATWKQQTCGIRDEPQFKCPLPRDSNEKSWYTGDIALQIFWAQPPVSRDHPYLKPSEISGNFSLFLNVYQTSNAYVCIKERGHITPEMLWFFPENRPSSNMSISENTFGSEGLHLLQLQMFEFSSLILVKSWKVSDTLIYPLLLILESAQCSGKREVGFGFLSQLVGSHRPEQM